MQQILLLSAASKSYWLKNFANKISLYSTPLGLTASELASILADIAVLLYALEITDFYKKEHSKRVAFKNMLLNDEQGSAPLAIPVTPALPVAPAAVATGISKRFAKLIKKIKASLAYTDTIGADLGIIDATPQMSKSDMVKLQPTLKVKFESGHPVIRWVKAKMTALDLFVDRGDGKGYAFIGTFTLSTITDPAPVTATGVWKYKGIFKLKDEQIGEYSEEVSVTVTPTISNGK